jgi:hypothetical protein
MVSAEIKQLCGLRLGTQKTKTICIFRVRVKLWNNTNIFRVLHGGVMGFTLHFNYQSWGNLVIKKTHDIGHQRFSLIH